MQTKKSKLKVVSKKSINWKKISLAIFFVIGIAIYFNSSTIILESPRINYIATDLDPEEAAYLQKAITNKATTATPKTTSNAQYGAEPVLVVPKTTTPVKTPVPNGIEAEEAAFIQKVVNKENTNSVGTAPAPIVSVTTQDANGNTYTAPIVLNKSTDFQGAEKTVESIANQIRTEVIQKATTVNKTVRIPATPTVSNLLTYGSNRALFCEGEGMYSPQGTFFFDRSTNKCYFCRVKVAGNYRQPEYWETKSSCKNPAFGDDKRDCALYQRNDLNGVTQYFFSTEKIHGYDKVIYYPRGSKVTFYPDENTAKKTARCKFENGESNWQ